MMRPENMTADPKPRLTPKLRFPEFRDGLGWETKTLAPFLEEAGGRVSSGTELPIYSSTRTGLKRQDDYYDGKTLLNSNDYGVVPAGCFVYRHMSDDGLFKFNINETGGEIAVSKEYPVFRTIGLVPGFLLNKLNNSADFAEFAMSQKAGGTRTRLYFSKLSTWETSIPLLAEQEKVAECLSTLDELIGAETQKLAGLKTYKKGLMQQLFPREGETLPRLRFPEFQHAPEWARKVGGDLFTNRKEAGEAGLPIYSVTINDGMVLRASFDRDFYDIEDPAGNKKVYKGDIAYNMMRMWQGAEGVAPEDCMVSPAYIVLKPQKRVCSYFFAHLFKLPQYLDLLTATSRGLTKDRLRLYFDDFARMRLRAPELDEQQRIASSLSSIDELIVTQCGKLSALNTHKKSLMQQVFPSPAVNP